MEHSMKLKPEPFEKIRSGIKTIELRLYDEKRKKIAKKDIICFHNMENENEILRAEVEEIYVFSSFEELYKNLPLLQCGYTKDTIASASPEDMTKYYSKEKQAEYGVTGIRLHLLEE